MEKKGMLYLKEANFEDVEKEYEFIVNTPADENGFSPMEAALQTGSMNSFRRIQMHFLNSKQMNRRKSNMIS